MSAETTLTPELADELWESASSSRQRLIDCNIDPYYAKSIQSFSTILALISFWRANNALAEMLASLQSELASVKEELKSAYERIDWLSGQREIEVRQKEAALAESGECLKERDALKAKLEAMSISEPAVCIYCGRYYAAHAEPELLCHPERAYPNTKWTPSARS